MKLDISVERGRGFIRVGDYGVAVKDTRRHRLYFSERNGYQPTTRIGHWCLTWLRPAPQAARQYVTHLECDHCRLRLVVSAPSQVDEANAILREAQAFGFETTMLGLLCGGCRKRVAGSLFGRVEVAQA